LTGSIIPGYGFAGIYVAAMSLEPRGGRTFRGGGNERAIMRYTLTVGLLVCMPTVALLAVAGVAVLAGNLRHRLGREADQSLPCRLIAAAVSRTA
jgi:hypothetical protein